MESFLKEMNLLIQEKILSFKDRDGTIKGGLTIPVSFFLSGEPGLVDRVLA